LNACNHKCSRSTQKCTVLKSIYYSAPPLSSFLVMIARSLTPPPL
jgi:hypothetical protein